MKLRALLGVLAVLVGGAFAASAAPAGAAPVAYPPSVCSTLSLDTTHPALGEKVTVTGSHFEPNGSIALVLVPESGGSTVPAGQVTANATGAFTTSVAMPAETVNQGTYSLTATNGFTRSGVCTADPSVSLLLGDGGAAGASSASGSGTAFTGVDIALLLGIGAALVAGGGALVLRGRRRVTA